MKIEFSSLDEAIAAFRRGEMIVVADDERRENEGDLIVAAEKITPEIVNFLVTHARGLICVAMTRERLQQLGISRMLPFGYNDPFRTAFTQSVDARNGISTGISAKDRAHTIKLLASGKSQPEDFVRPGHIFPLEAVDGGVLRRPGHTEAAIDLARLAGLTPAGAICEIMRKDGEMARLPELVRFAKKHKLKLISVAMIAAYRKRVEKLIEFEEEIQLPTILGPFRVRMYRSLMDGHHHLALIRGKPWQQKSPLVRVHSECLTGDAFGSLRCDCGSQLRKGLEMIAGEESGVLLYMRQEGRGIGLDQKIRAYALQEKGLDTVEANEQLGFEADLRDYSIAAQMLNDLKVRNIRLITNNPKKVSGLTEHGIAVAARIPLVMPGSEHSKRYLRTKKEKLGHIL